MAEKVSRRKYIAVAGAAAAAAVIGGAAYYLTRPAPPAPTPKPTPAPTPSPTPAIEVNFSKDLYHRIYEGEPWDITGSDYESVISKVTKDSFKEKFRKYQPPVRWIPPEGYKEVAKHVSSFKFINAGALKDDPATEMNAAIYEYLTGIKPVGVATSSAVLHPKQVTFLSAKVGSPEVLYIDRMFIWDYAIAGWLEPLDDLFDSKLEKVYHPEVLSACKINGHYYVVPGLGKGMMCFYRKDLFEEQGIGEPPKTWEDLVEIGKNLTLDTDKDGNIDVWGWVQAFSSEDPRILFENLWSWIYSQGARILDPKLGYPNLNTPEALNALTFLTDLVNKHKIASPGITTYGDKPALDQFLMGKAAMLGGWSWNWPRAVSTFGEDKVGIFPWPKSGGYMGTPEGEHASILDLDAWGVNAFAPKWQKYAAKMWCDMYRSYQGQWIETCIENNFGYIMHIYEDPEVQKTFPIVKVFLDYSFKHGVIESLPRCADIAHYSAGYLGAAVLGKADPKKTLEKIQKFIDGIFKV